MTFLSIFESSKIRLLIPSDQELAAIKEPNSLNSFAAHWAVGYPTAGDVLLAGLALDAGFPTPTPDAPWGLLQIESVATGLVVGGAGFKSAPVDGEVEIGYGVSEDFQNHGFATAAVAGLISVADRFAIRSLIAETETQNLPSQQVLMKNGFAKYEIDASEMIHWRRSIN